MKFSFSSFSLNKHDVIVGGVIALALLTAVLFLWDAIVFYQVAYGERRGVSEQAAKTSITEKDIDEAIEILDARKKRFDATINQE